MPDWSEVGVAGGWEETEELEERLLDENRRLSSRVQRLAAVLAEMAQDLASTRIENAALGREIRSLRAMGHGPARSTSREKA